jgi:hypothetical protein
MSRAALPWIAVWKKLLPGSAAPWLREADVHRDAGRHDEALAVLRRAAAIFENDTALRDRLAAALRDNARYPRPSAFTPRSTRTPKTSLTKSASQANSPAPRNSEDRWTR